MDKALENFGIFDFMGVWGPGAITVTYFYFTFQSVFKQCMEFFGVADPKVSEPYYLLILATAVAYVIGVILHELGKFIVEKFALFDTDEVKGLAHNPKAKLGGWFCSIKQEYKTTAENEIPESDFYNKINFDEARSYLKYAGKTGTKQIDKYHSICALSRSLSICFAAHAVVELIVGVANGPIYISTIIVDGVLAILFWVRTYRYFTSWIRNTLVQYYYCQKNTP